jgi:glycosyltransferase involved in cell wall biosynthesis
MAAGLPCVISDQVGIASDVKQFDAGLVISCQEKELASALEELLTDENLSQSLAGNAQRLARERFSVEAMTDSFINLYKSILVRQKAAFAEGA